MAEKTLNSRIIHKHDIEANWLKAENFIPKQGELIVYDKDENYNHERIKMGDGESYVNNLPFITDALNESLLEKIENIDVSDQINDAIANIEVVQSDWTQNDSTAADYIKNRTHYETITEEVLCDTTINIPVNTLLRVTNIPDEIIINYPNTASIKAKIDDIDCTIVAISNQWDFYNTSGTKLFTMYYDAARGCEVNVAAALGAGVHSIYIATEKATVVQLPDKYIPSSIPRRADIPHMAMPDWNAAEGEAGYVKNRTHYEEKTVYIPTTIVEVSNVDLFAELPVPTAEFVVREKYIVELNGTRYEVTAWMNNGDDAVYLGNGDIYGGAGKGDDVPFACDFYADGTMYLNVEVGGEYVINISTPGEVKKLDEKFLPDTIVRTDDLNTAISNIVIPDELADLADDATHRTVTDTEKQAWNNKSDFSGSYNDLTNKPTIPSIAGLASETYVNNAIKNLASTTYVDEAVAGLVDTAPDTLNTLNELAAALGDDPNFATTIATQLGEIETELAGKVVKVEGKGLSTNDYTNAEKARLATIASDYVTNSQIEELSDQVAAVHSHAVTYKGAAFANGIYKFTTNSEGHVTNATAVTKEDIVDLGIPAADTDTGVTSIEITGAGNAITSANYDPATRKLTLAKEATYTNAANTITEIAAGASLSGGGTSGSVEIKHINGSASSKALGLYKISTDATSHVSSAIAITKSDIVALGIPAQDTTYTAMTISEIDAICTIS